MRWGSSKKSGVSEVTGRVDASGHVGRPLKKARTESKYSWGVLSDLTKQLKGKLIRISHKFEKGKSFFQLQMDDELGVPRGMCCVRDSQFDDGEDGAYETAIKLRDLLYKGAGKPTVNRALALYLAELGSTC